jgi:quinol monooxygenase YgiN
VIELHLGIRVLPGCREALLDFLREAVPFYESPGGIRVRLLESAEDPDRFIEVVEYADEASYAADQARVAEDATMIAFLERWRALLAEPPGVAVYRSIAPDTIRP